MSASESRECRDCGCTDSEPCLFLSGDTCCWVEADLCSACAAMSEDGEGPVLVLPGSAEYRETLEAIRG